MQTNLFIPESQKPYLDVVRERIARYGASESSIQDLLAVLIGKNNPEICLKLAQLNVRELMNMSINDFKQIEGVTNSIAERLEAAIALAKKLAQAELPEMYKIRTPEDAAKYLQWMRHEEQEKFVVLYLNTKNQVIGEKVVFVGSLTASIVHPREIFKEGIKRSSANMIAAHSHPSGDPTPSREDVDFTKRLAECGKLLGIELLDHIIIGDGKYFSMKEKGYIE